LRTLALFVLAVNVAGYAMVPLLGQVTRFSDYHFGYILVALAAGGLGAIFPLVSHLCVSPNEKAGQKIGYLYMANILGSTLGTLLTGFILLDVAGLGWSSTLLCLSGGLVGLGLLQASGVSKHGWLLTWSFAGVFAVTIVFSQAFVFDGLSEMLILKREYKSSSRFADIVENKSGHIAVDKNGMVYGGGKYDGKFNTDLVVDTNMIVRPFSLSAFHPKIEHILVIGVATGAWTQVLAHHPQAKSLTAVEINDGYLELTRKYDVTRSLADNPKVQFIIDDGRRWLRRNPDKKFDLIVVNSTYNWRGMATQLLSKEFLELIREHLNPGGIYFYNTTRAPAVLHTGASTFPYAFRFINHLVLSDSEIKIDTDHLRSILIQYEIDGKRVLEPGSPHAEARLLEIMDQLGHFDLPGKNKYGVETRAHLIERTASAGIVTDDNMGTEWIVR
jgi:spermidine synthase